MKPAGAPPRALTTADDLVLELQCNADGQVTNTRALLEFMDEADDDGVIDPDEWRYIWRHVALEARWNGEQLATCRLLRGWMNKTSELVDRLRWQVHEMKKAAQGGLQHAHR
jgi:hypothetical protein